METTDIPIQDTIQIIILTTILITQQTAATIKMDTRCVTRDRL